MSGEQAIFNLEIKKKSGYQDIAFNMNIYNF